MEASPSFSETVFDRTPPFSTEAETAVLGGMLIDREAVTRAVEFVSDGMFYREGNRRLYRAMLRLFERGDVIDVITVSEELKKTGELDSSGGFDYLAQLVDAVPTAANLEYHARIVRDKALLRRLIEQSTAIIRDVYDQGEQDVADILDQAEARIFQVSESQRREGFVWIKEILWSTFEHIEKLQESGSGITGVATGFQDLDRMTTGLQRGDLAIVAGRPSMGKTTLAINIAENAAIGSKVPTAIFSMEMPSQQLAFRMISSLGRVDQTHLRTGNFPDEDWSRINTAVQLMSEAPIFIDDTPGLSPGEIRARARRLQREHGLGLIVVDYLQLMQVPGNKENRATEISEISRGLKALAKELECPVIALSQLNRSVEQRTDKQPVMSDLRESGAIEQDADLILFIYREEVYNKDTPRKGIADIVIAKQRNGPIGDFPLTFVGRYTKFENWVPDTYGNFPDEGSQ